MQGAGEAPFAMLRTLAYLLGIILLLTVLRAVIGWIARLVSSQLLGPSASTQSRRAPAEAPRKELKQDPVCGTYVPEDTAVTLTVDGRVTHFCSEQCRSRYRAS